MEPVSSLTPPSEESLIESCKQGNLSHVQSHLLGHGTKWIARGLQEATLANQLAVMQLLLENGAEIDEAVIVNARTIPAFQLLIKHGLQVNQPLSWGRTPLMSVNPPFSFVSFFIRPILL